eukprot:GHVU01103693.1.p1 GENE.GHVU01103693.1~~GHVU01103693.1.p1  ORF type:complete len:233 (-),score=20.58 GHVU01103693.1:212-910(-)
MTGNDSSEPDPSVGIPRCSTTPCPACAPPPPPTTATTAATTSEATSTAMPPTDSFIAAPEGRRFASSYGDHGRTRVSAVAALWAAAIVLLMLPAPAAAGEQQQWYEDEGKRGWIPELRTLNSDVAASRNGVYEFHRMGPDSMLPVETASAMAKEIEIIKTLPLPERYFSSPFLLKSDWFVAFALGVGIILGRFALSGAVHPKLRNVPCLFRYISNDGKRSERRVVKFGENMW